MQWLCTGPGLHTCEPLMGRLLTHAADRVALLKAWAYRSSPWEKEAARRSSQHVSQSQRSVRKTARAHAFFLIRSFA
eukprot:3797747-Prymnesium_polylepis.2